jgi:hypothetical protein
MRLAQMQKNVFELVSFLPFNINEKKKASKRGKKDAEKVLKTRKNLDFV